MRLFIKNIFVFLSVSITISFVFFLCYMKFMGFSQSDFPAPKITNSYTYNEKLRFLQNKKADIIGIGSSTTYFNLNSAPIVEFFHSNSYLNVSSWALTNFDTYMLLKLTTEIHKPKTVIMAGSVMDFSNNDKVCDYNDMKLYLTNSSTYSVLFRHTNILYILNEMPVIKKGNDEKYNNNSETLLFDKYGGVEIRKDSAIIYALQNNIKNPFFIRDKKYIDNFSITNSKLYEYNFRYLDSISNFCKVNDIKLYFFQAPIRQGLLKLAKKDLMLNINSHVERERQILKRDGHFFVNSFDTTWNDSLFVDGFHMNAEGARKFTTYCLDKCK